MIHQLDLRVNDLIYDDKKIIRPVTFVGQSIGIAIGAAEQIKIKPEDVSGIPLTKAVMTNAKFTKQSSMKHKPYVAVINSYQIFLYKQDSKFVFKINEVQISKPLEYVHQLQNLIRSLTGAEIKWQHNPITHIIAEELSHITKKG